MTRILVVEDSRTQAKQMQFLLEAQSYEVTVATNGVEALAVLKEGLPDLVLTDMSMPEMNGLELVEAIRRDYPGVPVILMTALGNEELAVLALQKGAASYIPKRNLALDLYDTIENVLTVSQSSRHEKRALDCLTQAEFHFVLNNDLTLIIPLIWYLEESVVRMHHCDRTELIRVGIALHEALVNAIEHGNLEVGSELRQDDDEKKYRALIDARRQEMPYRERRVKVRVQLLPAEVVYVVEDEGPGFDPKSLPDPDDLSNMERIGGRGLMLIRTFMDQVEYNERGNRITHEETPHSPGGGRQWCNRRNPPAVDKPGARR